MSDDELRKSESKDKRPNNEYFYPKDPSQRTNIIVNYIPDEMSKSEFVDFFAAVGPIDSVRWERKRYAFVKYTYHDHARLAIALFNGYLLDGKKLCVKWAIPGGFRAKSNLFVSGIPPNWQTEDLETAFEEFGQILEVRVLKADGGRSLGRGFVRFNTEDSSNEAIKHMNGWQVPGTYYALRVQVALPRRNKRKHIRKYGRDGVCRTDRREFVEYEQDRSYLREDPQPQPSLNIIPCQAESFHQNPPVAHPPQPYRLNNDHQYPNYPLASQSPLSIGSSYSSHSVCLDPYGDDISDVAAVDPCITTGYAWRTYYPPIQVRTNIGKRVFLPKLHPSVTELCIYTFASRYGMVEDVDLLLDNNGQSIGCAIVTFKTKAGALQACRFMAKASIIG